MKLPATILLNSLVCEHYPDIVDRIKLRDDDVCSHGRTNAETLGGLWEHDEATIIAEVTDTITKHVGAPPTGWMGPGAAESRVTIDLIKEAGYTHNLGWPVDDQPIWAPAGISAVGRSLFVATGNAFGASNWSDGEAVFRLSPDLRRSDDKRDYFAPPDWRSLDERDLDLGGTAPLPLTVNNQPLILALGKDGRAYLLDQNNLGGMVGASQPKPYLDGHSAPHPDSFR
jgi:peptidoglycan/xylan/chitin deacetylase (PgdA/CDA1 family)